MKKVMISQPMAGRTDEEIKDVREQATAILRGMGFSVVNTLFTDEWTNQKAMKERGVVHAPVFYLAKSLETMALCHAVYFCKGWKSARGCRIEHEVARAYGLGILYEEDEKA